MYLRRFVPRRKTRDGSALTRVHSDMDRLFDGFFRSPLTIDSWLAPVVRAGVRWSPALEISETDDEVTIRAEVPGVDKDELDISITDDVLTLSGEKKEESEEKDRGFYRSERRYGSFSRSLALPTAVDAEKISADYEDGIVTVRLPKAEESATRRIPVEAAKN